MISFLLSVHGYKVTQCFPFSLKDKEEERWIQYIAICISVSVSRTKKSYFPRWSYNLFLFFKMLPAASLLLESKRVKTYINKKIEW